MAKEASSTATGAEASSGLSGAWSSSTATTGLREAQGGEGVSGLYPATTLYPSTTLYPKAA